MFNKLSSRFLAMLCVASVVIAMSGLRVYAAVWDSGTAQLPKTNYYVQSNVYQSGVAFYKTHEFVVSAKLYEYNGSIKTAKWIKTEWNFTVTGLGVSCGNLSVGSISGNGFHGSWENNNAWISDMSGTFKIKGLPLRSTLSNTATALCDGVKASTTAEVSRWY